MPTTASTMFSTARRRVTRPSCSDTPKEVVRLVRMRTPAAA